MNDREKREREAEDMGQFFFFMGVAIVLGYFLRVHEWFTLDELGNDFTNTLIEIKRYIVYILTA